MANIEISRVINDTPKILKICMFCKAFDSVYCDLQNWLFLQQMTLAMTPAKLSLNINQSLITVPINTKYLCSKVCKGANNTYIFVLKLSGNIFTPILYLLKLMEAVKCLLILQQNQGYKNIKLWLHFLRYYHTAGLQTGFNRL